MSDDKVREVVPALSDGDESLDLLGGPSFEQRHLGVKVRR
jgi:hypothetical protein